MAIDLDRVVHGHFLTPEDVRTEVVRYDRAGKYYLEGEDKRRKPVTLQGAVDALLSPEAGDDAKAEYYLGKFGGQKFDACVRRTLAGSKS